MREALNRLMDSARQPLKEGRRWTLRGTVAKTTWGKLVSAQLKGHKGEVLNEAEVFQQGGFAWRPTRGSEVIIITVGGTGSHAVAVASADRGHPCPVELKPGETCVFNSLGSFLSFLEEETSLYSPKEAKIEAETRIDLKAPYIHLWLHRLVTHHLDPDLDFNFFAEDPAGLGGRMTLEDLFEAVANYFDLPAPPKRLMGGGGTGLLAAGGDKLIPAGEA
ncbi:MAG: phage baseplate assembly protein [Deltaproteobacteria bacterium]|nr:phage baseplate assembly protein [Deltaproteobacteria bacterium]